MKEKIGNVVLDFSQYHGEDVYSDGDKEEKELLSIAKEYKSEQYNEVIAAKKSWPVLYHFSHVRENIISWLPVTKKDKVLEIGSGCGAVTGALAELAESVTCIDLSKMRSEINAVRNKERENVKILVGNFEEIEASLTESYDYITLIGVFEYASSFISGDTPYETFLRKIEKHLAPGGRIVIAIENRLGLKYFAGCREDHSGIVSEGLLGYSGESYAKTFSRRELSRIVEKAGFMEYDFYYPYPDYKFPFAIYSDTYLPKKGDLLTNDRNFDRDRIKMFDERAQFDEIAEDGTFPKYSNSFLLMLKKDEAHETDKTRLPYHGEEVVYVKFSNERSPEFDIRTLITEAEDGRRTVWKSACTRRSAAHVERMGAFYEKKKGRKTVLELAPCRVYSERGLVSFPYVPGQTLAEQLDAILEWNQTEKGALSEQGYMEIRNCLTAYFKLLLRDAEAAMFEMTPEFEKIFGRIRFSKDVEAVKNANIDMIPDNILFTPEGTIRVIDYEWNYDFPIPYWYLVYRAIHYYVAVNPKREKIKESRLFCELEFPEEFLPVAEEMEKNFQNYIRKGRQTLSMLFSDIHGDVYSLNELMDGKRQSLEAQIVQVYENRGEGYKEEHSYYVWETKGKKHVDLVLPVTEDIVGLRIDPARQNCMVTVNELYARTVRGYKDLRFESNGEQADRNCILFMESDPQIYIDPLPRECEYICMQMEIEMDTCKILPYIHQIQDGLRSENARKEEQIAAQNVQIAALTESLSTIRESSAWKLTGPLRSTATGIRCLKENGLSYTMEEIGLKASSEAAKKNRKKRLDEIENERERVAFDRWLYEYEEKARKEKKEVSGDICFSILVPLYNTPLTFLKEMLKSVRHQTYTNWELCLADGSDAAHPEVGRVCRAYMEHDSRIRYQRLKENKGISGNTNACMEMATGDYIGLFDHDDLLDPSVLNEMAYAIETQKADYLYTDEYVFEGSPYEKKAYHFKPDYSPDSLRGNNYICHFSVFSRKLQARVGAFDPDCDGSQDHDFILRLTEQADKVYHIAKPLYYWRSHPASVASDVSAKSYVADAGILAVEKHLSRVGLKGSVESSGLHPTSYHIRYELLGHPMISILIPNKDHITDLLKCIQSIEAKSTYDNYEILVIENNSTMPETFACYRELKKDERIRILPYQGEFNYSAINNFAAGQANGEYFLLLNNDTEVISPDWMEELLMYAQRPDVGAVGAMLYYPDDTVQHAGVVIGIGGFAGHVHVGFPKGNGGYMSRMAYAGNVSAVTAACMMVSKKIYEEVGGLSEDFRVAFNDVDFCLKIREKGYLVVFNPYAELYHYESKSRGYETTPEKKARFDREVAHFKERWKKILQEGDPYFNPNFTLTRGDFYPKELL